MNWEQLYAAASPCERQEFIMCLLQRVDAQTQRLVIARGRLIHNRRRALAAHFINNRRRSLSPSLYLKTFMFILVTLSIATWLVALRIHPNVGAFQVFLYVSGLLIILSRKPNKRISHASAS